jgi:DNA replication protein DnaC
MAGRQETEHPGGQNLIRHASGSNGDDLIRHASGSNQVLIIDEIGYIPIDRHGANLFFQLISWRYERGAIIVTSNQGLGAWGEVFGDSVIAAAILDRLLHHSITINIKGESYRLREKLKAGLLKPKLGADRGSDADASTDKP